MFVAQFKDPSPKHRPGLDDFAVWRKLGVRCHCADRETLRFHAWPIRTLTLAFDVGQRLAMNICAVYSQLRGKIIAAVTGDRV